MKNKRFKYRESEKIYFEYLLKRSFLGKIYRNFILYPRLDKYLNGKTLDIGSGLGDMLSFRENTIGIDVNPLNIDHSKKRKLNAYLMKPNVIPFRDKTFDSVLLDNVLEHIESPPLLFKEIRRVLKPDGFLLIGVPGEKGYRSDDDHKIFYDEKKLQALAQKNHFNVDQFFYTPLVKSKFLSQHVRQYCIYSLWSMRN
jgi:SAM-dependent methyltransferase